MCTSQAGRARGTPGKMDAPIPQHLVPGIRAATLRRIQDYRRLLKDEPLQFWDVVILTAGNDRQKTMYEAQIQSKLRRKELPSSCKYFVFSDPPGPKVGDGGALLNALEQLAVQDSGHYIEQAKVLVIQAGGYSQRFPSASVVGKAFVSYPVDSTVLQMLELQLITYLDFPARMSPGVYVACSDVFLPCNMDGDWSFLEPGFTGIAIPSSSIVGTTHGVYVLDNAADIAEQYKKDPSKPTFMSSFGQFIHKVSQKEMEKCGAKVPGTDTVYIDHSYFVTSSVAKKLLQLYKKIKPLQFEVDGYADFLRPLGQNASMEYISSGAGASNCELQDVRRQLYDILNGIPARVILLHQGAFIHCGTAVEYLHHMCHSSFMKEASLFSHEAEVKYVGAPPLHQDDDSHAKRKCTSTSDNLPTVLRSVVDYEATISAGSVVELSTVGNSVHIGSSCIVSCVTLKPGLSIPDGSYMHTVAVEVDEAVMYATFALDVSDSLKTKATKEQAKDLLYCGLKVDVGAKRLGLASIDCIWQNKVDECSLWNARLFPVCATREESAEFAVKMLQALKLNISFSTDLSGMRCLSLQDMLQCSSLKETLSYMDGMVEKCGNV